MSLLLDMLEESEEEREKPISPATLPHVPVNVGLNPDPPPSMVNSLDLVLIEDEKREEPAFDQDLSWVLETNEATKEVKDFEVISTQEPSFPSLFVADVSLVRPDLVEEEEEPVPQQREQPPFERGNFQSLAVEPVEPLIALVKSVEPSLESVGLVNPVEPSLVPVVLTVEALQPKTNRKIPKPRIGKQTWLIGGGVVVLCGLGVGGYFAYESMVNETSLAMVSGERGRTRKVARPSPAVTTPASKGEESPPSASQPQQIEQAVQPVVSPSQPVASQSQPVAPPPESVAKTPEPLQSPEPLPIVPPPSKSEEPVVTLATNPGGVLN